MTQEPLHLFQSPSELFDGFTTISTASIVSYSLYVVFAIWAIYSAVATYHWLKYSHASSIAFPAIGIHLLVSFALIALALSGNLFL